MKKIRHLINYDNADLKNQLAKITYSFNKYDNFNRIERGLKIYNALIDYNIRNEVIPDRANYYLDSLIQSSQTDHVLEMKSYFPSNVGHAKSVFVAQITPY